MSEAVQPFLTPAELREITGARLARKQVAWLAERAVPFRFDGHRLYVLRVIAQEWELLGSRAAPELHTMLR